LSPVLTRVRAMRLTGRACGPATTPPAPVTNAGDAGAHRLASQEAAEQALFGERNVLVLIHPEDADEPSPLEKLRIPACGK
jgi:hypothetical protein